MCWKNAITMRKLKKLMIINAIVCLIIGIPLLLLPVKFMALFGLNLNPGGMIMTQLYGGALLGNFLIAWFSKNDNGSISLYAAVLYLFVYNGINFLVTLMATINGIMEVVGFSAVILFLFFTISYGYVMIAKLNVT